MELAVVIAEAEEMPTHIESSIHYSERHSMAELKMSPSLQN